MANVSEELTRLAQLREKGVLTDVEFEQQKSAVLAGDTGAPPAPKKKRSVFAIGCFGIVAIVVILGIISAIAGSKGGQPSAGKVATPSTPPIKVTVTELFDAYKSNEAAAQQAFGNGPLLVTGTADKVDLDITDTPELLLKTPNEFMSAHADLADESKPKAASISPGQKMTLLCSGVSEVMSIPMLKECVIQ